MAEYVLYRDPKQSVAARVEDLLSRMTVEEKVGQLAQHDGRDRLEQFLKEQHNGSFLQILGEDAGRAIELARKTRLGIPLLLGIDAIHGHSFWPGATIFPTQLGMACTWDREVIEKMGEITAREMRWTGVCWTFAPVLCIARDPRWGRVGETFGEDPTLIGDFACAMIHGLQGDDLSDPDRVLACAKHYVGYSETQGGRDASEGDTSHRKLRSYFLPPFERAARTGVGSFMTGYQSTEGVPMTVNRWALRTVLRDEWGYEGFLVTDWCTVSNLVVRQKICADYKEAAARAVTCGNDLIMATCEFYQGCLDALADGSLELKYVDEAVRRLLTVKFKLGLFEDDRMPDLERARARTGTPEHRAWALRAARESLVLLENRGLLPLGDLTGRKILVVGRNADDPLVQCGDWSLGTGQANGGGQHPRACTVTPVDALKEAFPGQVEYRPHGEGPLFDADLIVAVVGDNPAYWGEFRSTATLELPDGQNELLQKVAESGRPYVVVLLASKPLILPELIRRDAGAVILQFSPGMLGGQALVEALTGKLNPSGRLTISFPRHAGQLPVYYMQVRGQHGERYADLSQSPVYAFGEGRSYTTFAYEQVELDREVYGMADTLKLEVTVRNTGERDGVEVVQAYVSDLVTSVTWVDEELKGYARLEIPAGETRTARIEIPAAACSLVDAEGVRVVEPGEFELRVGPSSRSFARVLRFRIEK